MTSKTAVKVQMRSVLIYTSTPHHFYNQEVYMIGLFLWGKCERGINSNNDLSYM